MAKTIVIIGAGFSGTALAVNLLRNPAGQALRVILINRSGQMARGVAYGTNDRRHLLNVPAGNMSLLPDEPHQFVEYCQRVDASTTAKSFISRETYGHYLEQCLTEIELRNSPSGELIRMVGEVVRVGSMSGTRSGDAAIVYLRDGDTIHADHVVLACGHFAPASPPIEDRAFYASTRYIRDPWEPGALAVIPANEPVLLIGTGLTALDVASRLASENPLRKIHAVSRRGLTPQAHRSADDAVVSFNASELVDKMGQHMRGYVRALRVEIKRQALNGLDWRDLVAALRPHTAALWQRLPDDERRRFLRHLQAYWEVHRHRTAPESHRHFNALISSGTLRTMAGHLVRIQQTADTVSATLRPRGAAHLETIEVGYVVNCTGPGSSVTKVDDPLIRQLLADGTMSVDTIGCGIQVTDDYQLVGQHGTRSAVLRYIGPLLRARYWEATAVPELRQHAQRLAHMLSESKVGVAETAA